jgi:hypothetical protein
VTVGPSAGSSTATSRSNTEGHSASGSSTSSRPPVESINYDYINYILGRFEDTNRPRSTSASGDSGIRITSSIASVPPVGQRETRTARRYQVAARPVTVSTDQPRSTRQQARNIREREQAANADESSSGSSSGSNSSVDDAAGGATRPRLIVDEIDQENAAQSESDLGTISELSDLGSDLEGNEDSMHERDPINRNVIIIDSSTDERETDTERTRDEPENEPEEVPPGPSQAKRRRTSFQ